MLSDCWKLGLINNLDWLCSAGIRQEQDIYVRLIDSVTKQVISHLSIWQGFIHLLTKAHKSVPFIPTWFKWDPIVFSVPFLSDLVFFRTYLEEGGNCICLAEERLS